ncbi:hypothetical protein GCM10010193_69390 [Kitasatospora atroaurantiaca]|uniref:Uncharacterized protein n=1 Tax=Kitasatospora atroaurantiaca TaxID=285545 RepID=A0A561EN27_9ACTN|nr:hypothetical protein [Kitasatospora atroaurantiaca]TWE17028.1 hypothetical protein FB465_2030 [Kitasatospora atroaurantiaca]
MSAPNSRLRLQLDADAQIRARSVDGMPLALILCGSGLDIELVLPQQAVSAVGPINRLAERAAALQAEARRRASEHGTGDPR